MCGMADHVDGALAQWAVQCPELDVSPLAVTGRLSRLLRLLQAAQRRTFGEYGLDSSSFDVLATLRRSDPPHRLTPAALMRAGMITSGAVTQRLDRLETSRLVIRMPNPSDGRVVDVGLTDAGRELVDRVLPDYVATGERLLAGLTPDQRDDLAASLRLVLQSLGDTG